VSITLELSDKRELMAVYHAMMEAKFHPSPETSELQGDPFVARFSHQLVDQLIEQAVAEGQDEAANALRHWRQASEEYPQVVLLKERIGELTWWPTAEQEKRQLFIKDFLAPLLVDSRLLSELSTLG